MCNEISHLHADGKVKFCKQSPILIWIHLEEKIWENRKSTNAEYHLTLWDLVESD